MLTPAEKIGLGVVLFVLLCYIRVQWSRYREDYALGGICRRCGKAAQRYSEDHEPWCPRWRMRG